MASSEASKKQAQHKVLEGYELKKEDLTRANELIASLKETCKTRKVIHRVAGKDLKELKQCCETLTRYDEKQWSWTKTTTIKLEILRHSR